MKIYLVRHGTTPGNKLQQYIGRTDQPLCQEVGIGFPQVEHAFVSPMLRTRQTAAGLFPNAAQTVIEDLREMDFGVFEERSHRDMKEDAQYQAWLLTNCEAPCPGGEAVADFCDRCRSAFLSAVNNADTDDPLFFAVHGGTIMAIMSGFAVPQKPYFEWFCPNLGGYSADWDGHSLINWKEFTELSL